ncbi:MAG: hypothetical protein LUE24_02185, partial [Lachnospiraceae bacterium]|nr:hypothetical protein [Lachnospiraceae bacterium]
MGAEDESVNELIGQRVMHRKSKRRGIIKSIVGGKIEVMFGDDSSLFLFPAAFADTLILADESLQNKYQNSSAEASFSNFKKLYSRSIASEIDYLR